MTAAVGYPTLRLLRVAMDLMDGQPPLTLAGLEPGQWRMVNAQEDKRLEAVLRKGRPSGRGGRAGGGKGGKGGGWG
jgi:23S rRNA pseudouridine2457 synthase